MRYDDRLSTVLAGAVPTGTAAVAQYRQLVDILGQIGGDDVDERHAPALARIHQLRATVSDADRLLTVQCLSGRLVSPVLVQYLASEKPDIASAAVRAARLDDGQWAALVPALPTRARGFLRNRRDLGPRTQALLDQLGLYDTALPAAVAQPVIAVEAIADAAPEEMVETVFIPQSLVVEAEDAAEAAPPEDALTLAPEPDPEPQAEPEPEPAPMPVADNQGPQSIGEIVKRIEALQEVRIRQAMEESPARSRDGWQELEQAIQGAVPEQPVDEPAGEATIEAAIALASEPVAAEPVDEPFSAPGLWPEGHQHFQFATGVDGSIASTRGIMLGMVHGLSLAQPAITGYRGVDAAVSTAFSRRMPIRGGRADLGSAAALAGEWRIDADPCFDRATGRFTGYSGTLRRPMAWESAGPDGAPGLVGRDGLRQIVHELRTPLNAIMGFSEIIEQQLFGPVLSEYREMALRIRQDARQLLSGFDDLDTALRLDRNAIDDPQGHVPLTDLVERLSARVQPLLDYSGSALDIGSVPHGAIVAMSAQALDRIVPRLAGALIGSCQPGEVLAVALGHDAQGISLAFTRPQSLAGLDEDALLDVDRADAAPGDGGPLLGLGFCLRLVRNLLAGHGGQLRIDDQGLRLTLPDGGISAEAARS